MAITLINVWHSEHNYVEKYIPTIYIAIEDIAIAISIIIMAIAKYDIE